MEPITDSKGEVKMAEEQEFQAGVNTHENVIFSCYGGASNTGITSALASLEAVKELGLQKAAVMCLGGIAYQREICFRQDPGGKKDCYRGRLSL
jgi:uncharacterized metal-binding protein